MPRKLLRDDQWVLRPNEYCPPPADCALTSVCKAAAVACLSAFMISLSLSHQQKAYRIKSYERIDGSLVGCSSLSHPGLLQWNISVLIGGFKWQKLGLN